MATQERTRRDAILAAALQAFTERGYGATTMSHIRAASGASTGSLYHHFPSREHLAAALWLDGLGRFQTGFERAVLASRSARTGVRNGVLFHVEWVSAHPDLAQFLLADREAEVRKVAAPRLAEQNATFFANVSAWARRYEERGELRRVPFDVRYALWLGPAQELARLWLTDRPHALRDHAGTLADAAWAALRSEAE